MPEPLYRRVQGELTALIRTMQVGDVMPSEPELERRFNVSRITVRRAVDNLVDEGLVEKRQGYGTIVREPIARQDVGRLYSWTDEMRSRNLQSTSQLLSLSRQNPSRDLRTALRLEPGETLVVLSRLRSVGGTPLAIMVNYLRERYVPTLLDDGLAGESLYRQLTDRYHITLAHGHEDIRARRATDLEASLLAIDPEAPVLSVRRTTYLRGHIPFEVVEMAARGDLYHYRARLEGSGPVRMGAAL